MKARVYVPVRLKKRVVAWAIVDYADYHLVSSFRWFQHSKGYVRNQSRENRRDVGEGGFMHNRIVGGLPAGLQVDHRDRNPLNNCRQNLRICTPSQNQHNRGTPCNNKTGILGLCFFVHKKRRKGYWQVNLYMKGIRFARQFAFRQYREAVQYNRELRHKHLGEPL